MAGSVEVQAPPGLEEVNGFGGPSPLITSGVPTPGPIAPPPKPEGLKEELVREVTAAVREHIERKTADAVDTLWTKGQRAMQHLQQQQLDRTAQLQSQLLACAEAHQQLQRENAMLRSGLESLMKHLTLVFGAPPQTSMPPSGPPGVDPVVPLVGPPAEPPPAQPVLPPVAVPQQAPAAEAAAPKASADASTEDIHTPAGTPLPPGLSVAEELVTGPSPRPVLDNIPGLTAGTDDSISLSSTPTNAGQAQSAKAPTFSLTLRRADNVPLGLDVVGESDTDCLIVEDIRLGGAVEAWNRQCHGDSREIRRGDRITMINGAKDAETMQDECLNKHLLRMSVVRPDENAAARPPTSAAISAAAATGNGGLRAEASEFVPRARILSRASSC